MGRFGSGLSALLSSRVVADFLYPDPIQSGPLNPWDPHELDSTLDRYIYIYILFSSTRASNGNTITRLLASGEEM